MQKPTWSPGATCVTAAADLLHDARALVAEHHRPAPVAELAVHQPHVGVADARRRDSDEHLARRAAARARPPPRRARCRGSWRTAARIRISRPGTARARPSPGRRPGRVRPAARSSRRSAISSVDGEEPVAALGRPGGRIERHLEVGARRERERRVEVREQAVAVRPRMRAPRAYPAPRRARRRGGALDPAREHDVRLDDVDRRRGGRARAPRRPTAPSPRRRCGRRVRARSSAYPSMSSVGSGSSSQ